MDLQQRPVSPYSLRGIGRTLSRAYDGAVNATSGVIEGVANRFTPPAGYVPAVAQQPVAPQPVAVAPAVVPMQPAPTVGGAISAIRSRHQALADMADGGKVPGRSPHPAADNIPINATAGEYVLPVDTTRAVGKENLDALVDATHTPVRGPSAAGKKVKGRRRAPEQMADGGMVDDEEWKRPRSAGPSAAAQPGSGGAVFGLFPQLAGGRRTTYATDAALRTGVQATGPSSFQPAARVDLGGERALPRGVQPSTAGAGRGVVNPPPAVAAAPASVPATATAGAGRRFVDPQGNEVAAPAVATAPATAPAQPAATSSGVQLDTATDQRLAGARAAAVARGESLGTQDDLPEGYGTVTTPDRQAERNAAFDRQTIMDEARRIGGRGGARLLASLEAQDRIAAETANTGARERGAITRLATQEQGLDRRQARALEATEQREGPLRAAQTEEAQARARGAAQIQQAQQAYQAAVAGGDQRAIQQAEANLRAVQGQWQRDARFQAVSIPGGVDPVTGLETGSSLAVVNQATGEMQVTPAAAVRSGGQGARPAPAVGTVQGGYRFKGGNPADRNNWERV